MKKKVAALALATALILTSCGTKAPAESKPATTEQGAKGTGENGKLTLKDLEAVPMSGTGEWITAKDGSKWYKNTGTFYDTFDTVIQFISYTETEEEFQKYFDLMHKEYQRLTRLYDNYKTYDGVINLMSLNQTAHEKPVKVEKDLYDMLAFSLAQYDKTLGFVNIAMGAPLALWHDAREAAGVGGEGHDHAHEEKAGESVKVVPAESELQGQPPAEDALKEAGTHMDPKNIVLDPKEMTVELKDPKLMLDAGAVAKGYATEIVARKLQEAGFKNGIISAGGNIKTIGAPVDGREGWTVGISHPRPEENQMIATVVAKGTTSMVTSGDYQRFFFYNGKRMHHIIDPRTLQPTTKWTSVSVRTEDSGLADVLSTTFFIANEEEAKKVLANYADVPIDVVWIDQELNITQTPGIQDSLKMMK